MKIMVFTEGTALMFKSGLNLSREERVKMSQAKEKSVYDFASYLPAGRAVEKIKNWQEQEAEIYYLTSRQSKAEIDQIKKVLNTYQFPDAHNLVFRNKGEEYKAVAERIMPDILIEDDCESIGGEKEMTYPNLRPEIKSKIKSIVVKEFQGIDHLPDSLEELSHPRGVIKPSLQPA